MDHHSLDYDVISMAKLSNHLYNTFVSEYNITTYLYHRECKNGIDINSMNVYSSLTSCIEYVVAELMLLIAQDTGRLILTLRSLLHIAMESILTTTTTDVFLRLEEAVQHRDELRMKWTLLIKNPSVIQCISVDGVSMLIQRKCFILKNIDDILKQIMSILCDTVILSEDLRLATQYNAVVEVLKKYSVNIRPLSITEEDLLTQEAKRKCAMLVTESPWRFPPMDIIENERLRISTTSASLTYFYVNAYEASLCMHVFTSSPWLYEFKLSSMENTNGSFSCILLLVGAIRRWHISIGRVRAVFKRVTRDMISHLNFDAVRFKIKEAVHEAKGLLGDAKSIITCVTASDIHTSDIATYAGVLRDLITELRNELMCWMYVTISAARVKSRLDILIALHSVADRINDALGESVDDRVNVGHQNYNTDILTGLLRQFILSACASKCIDVWGSMPDSKDWRRRNRSSEPNDYASFLSNYALKDIVSFLKYTINIDSNDDDGYIIADAGAAIFQSWLKFLVHSRIKVGRDGAKQLRIDFTHMMRAWRKMLMSTYIPVSIISQASEHIKLKNIAAGITFVENHQNPSNRNSRARAIVQLSDEEKHLWTSLCSYRSPVLHYLQQFFCGSKCYDSRKSNQVASMRRELVENIMTDNYKDCIFQQHKLYQKKMNRINF